MAQLRVGGYWLAGIAWYGDLWWSHTADGGCREAGWRMALPEGFSHRALRRDSLVEIFDGPWRVWMGYLTEPDLSDLNDAGARFAALGLSSKGMDFLAIDSSEDPTTVPDTAIDEAISRGIGWTRPTTLATLPYAGTDPVDTLQYLTELLDPFAVSVSKRWGVDADGNVFLRADPTTPSWHMTPGSGRFGLADDDYASDLYGRYWDTVSTHATATASDAAARARFGRRELAIDMNDLGGLSAGTADNVLTGVLARGRARLGWTNGVAPTRFELTTPGGTPAHLPSVTAGQMVRLHGVVDEQGTPLPYVDFVIGESTYTAGEDSILLIPTEYAHRDFHNIVRSFIRPRKPVPRR